MRDKIQAMSSEAKASAIIIGSLPVVVMGILSLIAPDYISLLFSSTPGHLILFGAACVMTIGAAVMRGMINFDI
jgi:tight adherence protein B